MRDALTLDVGAFDPPAKRADRARWLEDRGDEFATFVSEFAADLVTGALSSLTASGFDQAEFDEFLTAWRAMSSSVGAEYAGSMFASGAVAAWNDAPAAFQSTGFLEDLGELVEQHAAVVVDDMTGFGVELRDLARQQAVETAATAATRQALSDGVATITDRVRDQAAARARDATIGAYNRGHTDQARRMGAEWKEWLATGDARTRPDHVEASGQRVPIGEPFVVGGELLDRPHDPAGSAAQVRNCRCTVLFGWADSLDATPG